MSLTPPQFVKMLKGRDRASLVTDLRSLADKWEDEARGWGPDGAEAMGAAAGDLRRVLNAHKH